MESQIQTSNKFRVKEICPVCSQTKITPKPESTPTIGEVAISQTAHNFNWKAFADLSKDCGLPCTGVDYTVECRTKGTTNAFSDDFNWNAFLGTSSSTGDYTI